MAIDYLQYQVARFWYHIFTVFVAVTHLVVLLIFGLSQILSVTQPFLQGFGVNLASAIISGMGLLFILLGYRRLVRYSLPFATLITALFYALGLLNGLAQTDGQPQSYAYIVMWFVLIFFAGFFGLPILIGASFVTLMTVLLQVKFDVTALPQAAIILSAVTMVIAPISYLFWKDKFVNADSEKVHELSGKLRENRKQSELLIQFLSDGVIVTNEEGKITLINPSAAIMTEWSQDEALGIDANLVAKFQKEEGEPEENFESPLQTTLTSKTSQNTILQLIGRNGKQTVVSVSVSPIIPPETQQLTGVVAVIRDVSVSRKEEKQRADFISTASHEMRTPVAAIEGYLALALNEKVSKIDPKARGYLEKAHESTQHLGKLFQDLLTSAKAEDGRLVSHPVIIEMGTYLEQLSDGFRFAAQKKGLLSDFAIGANSKAGEKVVRPLYYVHADPDRLREVITNLFDNAVKYTPNGKISIGVTGNNDVVQLFVRDTGPGIAPEDVPHLFQKFYRVDNTATRAIGGTGLGLFICRKIVELYKGRIWVESSVGQGSTFYINLPRISTQKAAEMQAKEAQQPAQAPVTSLTTPV